jgi:hypothetical protein
MTNKDMIINIMFQIHDYDNKHMWAFNYKINNLYNELLNWENNYKVIYNKINSNILELFIKNLILNRLEYDIKSYMIEELQYTTTMTNITFFQTNLLYDIVQNKIIHAKLVIGKEDNILLRSHRIIHIII